MVHVSRLDGGRFIINALLIETIEAVPDTVITMTTGRKHVVRESVQEVLDQVATYHRSLHRDVSTHPSSGGGEDRGE